MAVGVVRRANEGMVAHRDLWQVIGLVKEEQDRFFEVRAQASADGKSLRQNLDAAIEKITNEVQALGIQMNQSYVNSALTKIENVDIHPTFADPNPIKHLLVSTFPGYHLPHIWLCEPGKKERLSTLDLAGHGVFTLLTGIGGDKWKVTAAELTHRSKLILNAFSIGYRQDYADMYRDWPKIREVDEDGAILVRPDHFIA